MEQNLKAVIHGLKCDNPTCDYTDDSIQLEQYESYINTPCPKCASPLLTQADYDQLQQLLKIVELADSISIPPSFTSDEKDMLRVEVDGTGEMEFEMKPYEEQGKRP